MKKKWELRHCDLDLWPKVTKFNRVWASDESNHLAKTAFKSVHPFGWNFVHKNIRTDTHTHTHTQTDTQTNCSENITPPRFRGGVIMQYWFLLYSKYIQKNEYKINTSNMRILLSMVCRPIIIWKCHVRLITLHLQICHFHISVHNQVLCLVIWRW